MSKQKLLRTIGLLMSCCGVLLLLGAGLVYFTQGLVAVTGLNSPGALLIFGLLWGVLLLLAGLILLWANAVWSQRG